MAWGIFDRIKRKSDASDTSLSRISTNSTRSPTRHGRHSSIANSLDSSDRTLTPMHASHSRPRNMSNVEQFTLDPESDPLGMPILVVRRTTTYPKKKERSIKSFKSSVSNDSNDTSTSQSRHRKSRDMFPIPTNLKYLPEIRKEASNYLYSSKRSTLVCFTCGNTMKEVTCNGCQTMYLPPNFEADQVLSQSWNGSSKDDVIDFNLVDSVCKSNEPAILESMLYNYFTNKNTINNTFAAKRSNPFDNTINVAAMSDFFRIVNQSPSSSPYRGVLQAAQCVLQTRNHTPVTKVEIIYIFILLNCPAITDCSMFTKVTGPTQKLSKYISLRSRARIVLELCAGLIAQSDRKDHEKIAVIFNQLDNKSLETLIWLCNGYTSHRLSFISESETGTKVQLRSTRFIKNDWYCSDWRLASIVKLQSVFWVIANSRCTGSKKSKNQMFYNVMTDLVDISDDFDYWEKGKTDKFCFCRYPFTLSLPSKARALEYAAQKEASDKVRKELLEVSRRRDFSQSLTSQRALISSIKTLTLTVNRNTLFTDSVHQLLHWEKHRKRFLHIVFNGEKGIDAGGLAKEWFHMFFNELFSPQRDIFVADDTSNYCWFANESDLTLYEVSGVALGLALVNGVTLDINLPLLMFKILTDHPYDMSDIAEIWPEISHSLTSIMECDDPNFQDVFGLSFVDFENKPLVLNGENIDVTLENKFEYVELMVNHLVKINTDQLKTFKTAFLNVCGNNALALFEPEELELLVHGDRQPLDVDSLRAVTKYVNFGGKYDQANMQPIVIWFWDIFAKYTPAEQASFLKFVTSTDRVPPTGITTMKFVISCSGEDCEKLPTARTCFNTLCLYKYRNKKKLAEKLALAINECQGFELS